MTHSIVRLVTRNFQLKVIAVVVACGMWVGVVYASDPPAISTFTVQVQSDQGLRPGLVLLRPLGKVAVKMAGVASNVHSSDVSSHLDALADLGSITRPGHYRVPLKVSNSDDGVWIWSAPSSVEVWVDSQATREVQVHLDVVANPPAGYTVNVAQSTISPADVEVTGPESLLAEVQAEAKVNLSPYRTSLPIPSSVILVTGSGVASGVHSDPSSVTVTVDITSVTSEAVLPVRPVFSGNGQPPAGYSITSWQVEPLFVTVTGPSALIATLTSISTQPIDLANLTASTTKSATLVAPTGTTLSTSQVDVVFTVQPTASASPSPSPSPTPTP